MRGYSDLEVWRKAMDLAVVVYGLVRVMPKTEQFAMTSQMTRAATSIPSNIAEGYQRSSRRDYARFISIARGSQAELETLLLLARRVGHLPDRDVEPALEAAAEVGRMLSRLRQRLEEQPLAPSP